MKIKILILLTLCFHMSAVASDQDKKQIQKRGAPSVTLADLKELERLYNLTTSSYTDGNQDQARSTFEQYIQHPAYKQAIKPEQIFEDLTSYIPLYLGKADLLMRRLLVFNTYLHDPNTIKYLGTKQAYILWKIAALDCLVSKNNEGAQKYYSYFIFKTDLSSYSSDQEIVEQTKLALSTFPYGTQEHFQLSKRIFNSSQFQGDLKKDPINSLIFCEKTVVSSTKFEELTEQLNMLRTYIFHPEMPNTLKRTNRYHGILLALNTFNQAKCAEEYIKLYSQYSNDLSISDHFKPQELFDYHLYAALFYNQLGQYHETIKLLPSFLENLTPKSESEILFNLKAKETLALAYFDSNQKQRAVSLFQQILKHPQISITKIKYSLLRNALRCFVMNNDYHLGAELADTHFKHMPSLVKSEGLKEIPNVLMNILVSYIHMDQKEEILSIVEYFHSALEKKHFAKSPTNESTALYPSLFFGLTILGKNEISIKYGEEMLKIPSLTTANKTFNMPLILSKMYYGLGQYDKASDALDSIDQIPSLTDRCFHVLCKMKAGKQRKARSLAKQIEESLRGQSFDPTFNAYLYLAYAYSQSTLENDNNISRGWLNRLSYMANFLVFLGAEDDTLTTNLGFGVNILDIAKQGEAAFEQLKKFSLALINIDPFEEDSSGAVYSAGTSPLANLKKDFRLLQDEYIAKVKRKGKPDANRAKAEAKDDDKATKEEQTGEYDLPPLVLTSGGKTVLECFQSLDWKEVNAIRWNQIDTFFSSNQGPQGIVFTVHGHGTDHVTYTIYKKGSDLSDTTKKPENTMVTLVNTGSKTAPIKFYLKKKLRDALQEMGYLTEPTE